MQNTVLNVVSSKDEIIFDLKKFIIHVEYRHVSKLITQIKWSKYLKRDITCNEISKLVASNAD